jgi:hypothetical protein
MTDAPTTPPSKRGFSSRWILDRDSAAATPQVDTGATRSATVDTDGDGIADTLALRIDQAPAERPGSVRSFGAWLGRSVATLVFVAALVAAGIAVTLAYEAREQAREATTDLRVAEAQAADAQEQVRALSQDLDQLRRDATTAEAEAVTLEQERDDLELENRVLRRLVVDAERRAGDE